MKKWICLVLVLAMALSLAACGSNGSASGKVTPSQEVSATVPAGNVEQPEETEHLDNSEKELSLGRVEGGVYSNEYVGYACKLDSNWTFLSAKELEQIPDTVADAVSGSELGDILANVQQFTDMMTENVNDLTTMNVIYQKLSMQERLAYVAMSEEQEIDATLAQADILIDAYAQAGILVSSMEKVKVTFLGEEHFALYTVSTVQDVPYYILQIFDFDLGSYAVTTTMASYVEDKTGDLAALFYRLED